MSIHTTNCGTFTNFFVKVIYDSGAFQFVSINALRDDVQVFSANRTNGRSGELTLQYSGTTPLESGEVCTLNFRAQDSSEDQSYDLTLVQDNVIVGTSTNSAMVYDFVNGAVSLC